MAALCARDGATHFVRSFTACPACLAWSCPQNHGNVQTKYLFEPPPCGEAVFRLFPTGGNRYGVGREVFNSYGRRANDNLLIDYGFAILGNE